MDERYEKEQQDEEDREKGIVEGVPTCMFLLTEAGEAEHTAEHADTNSFNALCSRLSQQHYAPGSTTVLLECQSVLCVLSLNTLKLV